MSFHVHQQGTMAASHDASRWTYNHRQLSICTQTYMALIH